MNDHGNTGGRRGRGLLLAGGGFALLMGVWTGLARAGVHDAVGPVAEHGVIMVLGFLGTLIALERAVALRAGWAFVAPALTVSSVIWLTAGLPVAGAGVLLTVAGLVVTGAYGVMLARRVELHLLAMTAGAVAWVVAAALWTLGWSPIRLAPTLAAFLVLTIVGERIELSRLGGPSPASVRRLTVALVVFGAGALASLIVQSVGLVVFGIGLVVLTGWLVGHDIARGTIRRAGLPRFAAACVLAGYVWLAVAGVLWVAVGVGLAGPLLHDAALHAVFLGFVLSMVMGHAPIILPAVTGAQLPYHWSAWVPLVVLHVSVAARVAADLAGSVWLRGWAAHGNTTALLLFAAFVVAGSRGRRSLAADCVDGLVPKPLVASAPGVAQLADRGAPNDAARVAGPAERTQRGSS